MLLDGIHGRVNINKACLAIAISCLAHATVEAQETTTYEYDSLGRLITTQKSGGPKNGESTSAAYDPAGNRSGYAVNAQAPAPPAGATFQIFGSTAINEGASTSLNVQRTGGISNAASVNYASTNGSAAAPGDYDSVSGTLNFTAFETQKLITVNALVDTLTEPAEAFSVALSNPSSGSVINGGPATVTINANTWSPPNQPPTAQTASVSVGVCQSTTITITASDPENDLPITITAGSAAGFAEVVPGGGLSLTIYGYVVGSQALTFTIADSIGSPLGTGQVNVTVTNGNGCARVGGGG